MKTKYQQNLTATALTFVLAATVTAARADDTVATPASTPTAAPVTSPGMTAPDTMNEDSWQFGVTVPLWAPQINGNATIRGRQQDVNVNFSELKDHLDTSLALALTA